MVIRLAYQAHNNECLVMVPACRLNTLWARFQLILFGLPLGRYVFQQRLYFSHFHLRKYTAPPHSCFLKYFSCEV